MTVFRSAITNKDGDVDSGYLAMFVLMVMVTGSIPLMCIGAFVAMWLAPDHKFAVQDLGIGIGAVCGGFATAIGAIGVFRMGDKDAPPVNVVNDRRAAVSSTITTTETKTAAPMAKAGATPMEVDDVNITAIGDVTVELIKKKKAPK